ncbi:FUSC family protein [Litoribaculum gwangyangense]|uniref:FUSC family protein n=1 Tax=Litoribaculum gwangyangense TaxID=1130722 RepID=A0ABP9CFR1_9FLAO
MKKVFTILALIAAILAIIFSVLPISNLAIFPSVIGLLFVIIAFYLSKKSGDIKKIIQFIFLLIIMALGITTYKAIFMETKVASTKVLEATETKLEEEAIEELEDLDIEDIEIENTNIENISTDK